jgi:hypothetical protein
MTPAGAFSASVALFGLACAVLGAERLILLRRKSTWACLNAGFAVEKEQFSDSAKYLKAKSLVQVAKVSGGLLCLALVWLAPAAVAVALIAVATVLVIDRTMEHVGGDGADQQLRIVGVALSLTSIASIFDPSASKACIAFLACQLALCYSVAGCLKAANPEWRSGDAIRSIAAARGYGEGRFSPVLLRYPRLAIGISWAVSVFESSFPVYMLSGRTAMIGLGLAFTFHLTLAVGIRLNSFLWVFPISFPAFYAFAEQIYRFIQGPY